MANLKIEDVDVDGAVRDSAERASFELEREGDTRAAFLKKAGLAGGAAIGGGALLGGLVPGSALAAPKGGRPPRSFGRGDTGILNYALTLEYLESAFYNRAQKNQDTTPFITDDSTLRFLAATVRDEKAHVKTLQQVLGRKAVDRPTFDFGNTVSDQDAFQQTAFALENTGVSAYLGQAYNIKSRAVGEAALSIATIEGRHAGLIGEIVAAAAGDDYEESANRIAPDGPFDKPLSAKRVLRIVKSTGFIQ
ncbi:ferritin-like domain-containing protein [Thermoleophilia bacterium SCSIO 60948]|nr:ferritin-like domain-containing protein [Thermoleophilia bacterium SCSIO 60948]